MYLLGKVSEKELKQYSEELNAITDGSDKKFIELYHKAKEGSKYNFMVLDFKKLRVLKNFDEILHEENEEENKNNNDKSEDLKELLEEENHKKIDSEKEE
jgi:hypothetical protein